MTVVAVLLDAYGRTQRFEDPLGGMCDAAGGFGEVIPSLASVDTDGVNKVTYRQHDLALLSSELDAALAAVPPRDRVRGRRKETWRGLLRLRRMVELCGYDGNLTLELSWSN